MSERLGKLFHHSDPLLDQELSRLYDFVQNGILGRGQIDTRSLAEVMGREIGQSIPPQTIDGRAIKLASILSNRLQDAIVTGNTLDQTTASRIHDDGDWTIGAQVGDVRAIDLQVNTVKPGLSAVSSVVVFWGSTSSNKNAAPPTTNFTSLAVATGTLLADLGAIAGTPELCLLLGTTTAGRVIVDVEVTGASTLFFYASSGPMITESGAVSWT